MAFDNTKLSYFHSFSKMPAQNSTSLGNAINKSGHTVTASEVWSQDIPYYGKMGSLADVITKVQPYARKNDMCYITAGDDKGKTFQYDGEGNWTDITATLVDGALIKNANDDVVLLYHKGQTLTNLTADNNANTDSADNAARLWAKRAKDGSQLPEGETRLIEQFVAPTDKALNGLASVAYAPVIANGSLVSGTGYYDYCFSGTILWATARTASTLIDCFEYVGDKIDSSLSAHQDKFIELDDKLSKISVTAAGGIQDVTANAKTAGFSVTTETKTDEDGNEITTPLLDINKATVTDGVIDTTTGNGDKVISATDAAALAAKALADAKAYSDNLHSTNLVYVVLGDNDTLPTAGPNTIGKIYLVKEGNTANGETSIDAISGSYVEYMTRKVSDTQYTWEKIGTTAADLDGYIKTIKEANGVSGVVTGNEVEITVQDGKTTQKGIVQLASTHEAADTTKAATGATVAAAINALDATDIGDGAVKVSQTNGIVSSVSVTTETLVDNNAIKTSVADTNALITANDALAAIKLAKPENYISTVSDGKTDAEGNYVNETSGETKLVIKDAREKIYDNDLWGTTVSMVDNTITVQGGPIDGTEWAAKNGYNTITKVENNMVYNETTEVANIKTNELVNGSNMFNGTSLASFNGDLSSLINGSHMFYTTSLASFSEDLSSLVYSFSMFGNTSLISFNGNLSSLINGSNMFYDTPLESFSGDLSSLVHGSNMFSSTSLESFSGDLSSLVDGSYMFQRTPLESFSGDLSSLVDGNSMFDDTSLTSFSGDLSSLVDGSYMFSQTSLDIESVELICDVLPNYNTKNGGKTLQTATWNESGENKGKYTYSDWESGNCYYPIIGIYTGSSTSDIDRIFDTKHISESNVKTITITWKSGSPILGEGYEADRVKIAELFTNTAKEKGWTFLVNTEIAESGEIAPPNAVMATDGTIQYYILAKKDEATEDNATHIDASGKLWKFDTAEAIIGPNIKYWSIFATVEDALTEWGLTPWSKPIEEESAE